MFLRSQHYRVTIIHLYGNVVLYNLYDCVLLKDTEICQICIVNHSEIGGERIIQSYRIHSFIMDRTVFFFLYLIQNKSHEQVHYFTAGVQGRV